MTDKTEPNIESSKTPTIKPCPMPECGGLGRITLVDERFFVVRCRNCSLAAPRALTALDAVINFHKLCEYVRLGKAAEAFKRNPPTFRKVADTDLTEEEEVALRHGYSWAVEDCQRMLEVKGDQR